ncbi:ATP-binding protein [Nostoc sp. KVJ20]|uniref:AAA family ATPase n=1 Tax=Nostoc sp. KVJ20 TaxID=457944 RepID=UPI00083CA811|nr:AAA family ATPase [Nostoc sp. KVJ20]ODG98702.1 ATP-binding protein [Nostoc sp. KVJ20]
MKVKRLEMQSFRGIGDLTLEFDETGPTVLIGINGVGKSSILDCLAIFLSQFTAYIQSSSDSIRFFNNKDISNGCEETHNEITFLIDSQEIVLNITKISSGVIQESLTRHRELFQFSVLLKEKLQMQQISNSEYQQLQPILNSIFTTIDPEISDPVSLDNDNPATLSSLQYTKGLQAVVDALRHQLENSFEANIPLVIYYPVNRAVIDMPLEISEVSSFKQVDAYNQALTGGRIDFKTFFEWFRNREDLENERRRDNPDYRDKQLETVRQAISSLIPEFSNLRVERSPLRMTVRKRNEKLIVNQLSDGEKCLLAMVGDLARRLAIANPGLTEPLEGEGVVLIDEIELHLHPKWQREIIPALTRTFPNCQFIVTTHSPQVLSQVKPEGIYILEKTDEGVIAKKPESSFGRDSNRILEDLMGVPERPQEIKESLLELFRLIDAGNIEGARQLRQQLAIEIGADEPEFVKADVLIRRKEILNR